ncbi:MAG TPA: YggS family pyridoxal phosphate-dependent enzyme, partial [candidate division Zixibacteria bacterium]|nr:YggS family pyridoxal phosphate-dependent enzyme [candidate division Zixibacteria bacterium]
MSVKENLIKLLEQIRQTSEKFGRNPDEIKLVAVTKYADIPQIREAYEAGQRDFGENYVQQALPKIAALPDDINWHFIGHIQKNKI